MIEKCKKEIIILSVGEPVPEELFLACVRAIQRGVTVRMMAQKYDKTNKELLHNWKKNGYLLRHLAKPNLDFTLVTYDDFAVVLQIREPGNSDARSGIAIYNTNYVESQILFLMSMWDKAKDID